MPVSGLIKLGRIMGDREEDLKDAPIADAVGIKGDADRFRMARSSRAHGFILSRCSVAAGVARNGACHALDMLKHALHAPEAAAGEDSNLRAILSRRLVERRRRDHPRLLGNR